VVGAQVELGPGRVMVVVTGPGHKLVVADVSGPAVVEVLGAVVVVALTVAEYKRQGHALDSFEICDAGPQLLRNAGSEAVAVVATVVDISDAQKLYALAAFCWLNTAR
jgi:hypothetical protein